MRKDIPDLRTYSRYTTSSGQANAPARSIIRAPPAAQVVGLSRCNPLRFSA